MVNKKGYLRTLEAIIGVLIIFAFVMTILPVKSANTAKIPLELELTTEAILKEIQSNNQFRSCVLTNNLTCLDKFVSKNLDPNISPWEYAFNVCDELNNCIAYSPKDTTLTQITSILPGAKNIYSKGIFISVEDITGKQDILVAESDQNKMFKLYMWAK